MVRLTPERMQERVEAELDRFTIWPEGGDAEGGA